MSTNIKINIVEPGTPPSPTPTPAPTPIDPSTTGTTDISVPDTGLFTHGIGGSEATIIGVAMLLAVVAAVVILYKKHKTQGKATKLVRMVDHTKTIFKSKKRITASLTVLALLASAGTLAVLLASSGKSNTNAIEGGTELTVDVDSEDLTIEVGDTPVFAYLPVKLTVEEATTAGYTLTAYTDSTDLVSTTDNTNIIPMVAADEGELVDLAEDTYGLSLVKPESQTDETFTVLSTDADAPTIITDKDYEATEANDTTTIYYGFYITPDVPKGTYEGIEISYAATVNRTDLAKVTFDGNGLTFNGAETNIVRYEIVTTTDTEKYSHTPNISDAGVQDGSYPLGDAKTSVVTIPGASRLHINMTYGDGIGYYSDDFVCFWSGAVPTMTATRSNCESGISVEGANNGRYIFNSSYSPTPKNTIEADIDDSSSVTFAYVTTTNSGGSGDHTGYGYYAVVTGYNENGDPVYLDKNLVAAGNYKEPSSSAAYRFLGWSTDQSATAATYSNADDIMNNLSISTGDEVTLYAVWQKGVEIAYDGNGANDNTNMDNVEQHGYAFDLASANLQVDLLASNFTKDGYGFVGWSTDAEAWDHLTDNDDINNPTIYGPNQTITIDEAVIAEVGENRKLVLNAVWAPVETTASGDPVSLQDWQGCSNLTATTYDTETGTLNVGKNTITALTDSRDGNIYTVARLADGNCWMTENLRLDNEATVSTTNTNNPVTVDNNVAIKNNDGNTSAHLSPTTNSWCTNSDSECYDQSYLNTNNTALAAVSPTLSQDFTSSVHDYNTGSLNANISSYGNYYNWYSTTAGNGIYSKGSGEVAGDICPAGWNLPMGSSNNTSGSFYYLNQQMGGNTSKQGSNNWRSFPNNFVYSGYWYGSSADYRGISGSYWSSTAYGTGDAYYLYFYSDIVDPGTYSYLKYNGYSVRCVAPVQTTITFDGNGNDGGEMAKQGIGENTTAPLNQNRFTKSGYAFASWNTERDGSGTSYTDGQDYAAGEGINKVTLYAQWEELPIMQDVVSWGSTLDEGDIAQAVDSRDGKTYWVAKLADGNIWMTQNLDLDIEAGRTYTSADTDLANSTIGTTWTPTVSTSTTSSWTISNSAPQSYDPGNLYWNGTIDTSYSGTLSNRTTTDPSATSGGTHYHVGNYYNWTAAVAMSDSSSYTTDQQDVNQSICPAGWRLPTYSGDKSYQNLVSAESLSAGTGGNIQNSPTYFVYGGYWNGSSYRVGYNGGYWPSVVTDSSSAYHLYFNAYGNLYPQTNDNRGTGNPVRCVAR